MKPVDLYARVRHACRIEGLSQRETARRFGIDPKTVRKMLSFSVPPGYRRSKPPSRPKLGPVTPIIDQILATDRASPSKQRHTAKRIYERLRDEHGFTSLIAKGEWWSGASVRRGSQRSKAWTASTLPLS